MFIYVLALNNSAKANRIDADQQIDTLLKKIMQAESENEVSVLLHLCIGTKEGSLRELSYVIILWRFSQWNKVIKDKL